MPSRRGLVALLLLVVLALAPAVASAADRQEPPPSDQSGQEAPGDAPGPEIHGPTPRAAWTARIVDPVVARVRPHPRARAVRRLTPRAQWWGGPEVLLVLGSRVVDGERWLDVLVKGMPAGSHGWIPEYAATVRRTDRRIVVDLSARTLVFQRAGKTRLRSRVVIGARGTPTPTGQFAVDAAPSVPRRAKLGPRVLAVVAYSRTLTEYDGGLPQTAIHAAEYLGAPLGSAASHGCVRMPQRLVNRLLALAPRGTPVLIQP
ncbi:L,D-transpeptidase family protein [Conexibacter arvalis]|uniref:L,D-transpeptidase family protein n=1 Tax=Conexibacter arvalis TaxID=912552 RepID=UPI001620B592